jgi:chromosomal replication initiator protein
LNPRYTFENFIVGENNELARAASFAVSQSPGTLYNPLFIYGVVGVGKTHLLQSIGNEAIRNNPNTVVRYTTSEQFTNELINHLKSQTMETFKQAYREIDILLIDDVQVLSGREKTQQEFFHVFNNLHQLNKQVVITSDRTPRAIPTIEDRLKSRFEGGMIADVSRPDLETRMAILRLKLLEKSATLEEDCIRFIAENITNNARELEGALNRVLVSAEFQRVRPTVPYITKVLGQIITANKKAITLESITKASAEFYNVPEEELYKKGRKKEIALARQVAMYLARTELDVSLSAIGKHFGGRDHTTVLHGIERIKKDMDKDGHFKEDMVSLREQLYRE